MDDYEFRKTIREALEAWNAATPEQREEALRVAAARSLVIETDDDNKDEGDV